ncbi:MAG: hypothetical protein ACLTBV_28365 [Enterocloster bolteae]
MALWQGVVNEQRVKSVVGRLIECFERVLEELLKECCITADRNCRMPKGWGELPDFVPAG